MKYDSSMTQFHKNIIAALRHMLGNNSEIAKKFSPNDGSPAPLRDYLKQKYGKSYTSHVGNGMRYSCKTSTGFELTFDTILNNPGDKNLTLSWSQTAKFIRDNWDEVFEKAEPQSNPIGVSAENQPSYLFDGDGINDPRNDKCNYTTKDYEACQKCWRERCPTDADLLIDPNFEEDYFGHYPAEDTVPEISEEKSETDKSTENQVVPLDNGEISSVFDYSELDSDTADKLRAVSERVISIKATYIIETAKQVKAAHDLLANHYKGLWGAWCESVGFSRHTGTNLVHVAETFPDLEVVENFDNLDRSLLYAASKPSAPKELVEQVKSGDITTHNDYIALKKKLDEANKSAETERKARESIHENYESLQESYQEYKNKYTEEYYKNEDLEKRVKELENRPIDVCVDHNEVTRRVTEAVNKINSETEKTLAAREQEFAETLHFKDERIWELEDKLKELGIGSTDKKLYMVSMTEEDCQKMIAELSGGLGKILTSAVVIDPYENRGGQ